ncbi:MAG TPA: ABC transporter permease [Pyrinomonadaceae bacterium]|jgi:lipoprotein-releasing system permease protein
MPFELFLALRYLQRSKRRGRQRSARVTALAGVAGIACGVGALIFALALSNGFQDEMRAKILGGTAHITLTRADGGKLIEDTPAVIARLRTIEGVVDAAPTSYTGALLSGAGGDSYTILRGVEKTSARAVAEIRRTLVEGAIEPLFEETQDAERPDPQLRRYPVTPVPGETEPDTGTLFSTLPDEQDASPAPIVIGAELAARTGLRRIGDEGWLITGQRFSEPPWFVTQTSRVRVVGLFRSGLYEYDATWVYVPLPHTKGEKGAQPGAPVISIETADIYRTRETAARVRDALGANFKTVDWQEVNAPLFAALQLERRTVALIIALIMFVAALNITTTLVLVVIERRPDIAILGAMGARPHSIMLIFICEGAIIGAVGACAGVALGLAACFIGERFKLVSLPADVYSLSAIPFHPHAGDVVLAALFAFIISLLATIYPARAAARLRPAEALRYE